MDYKKKYKEALERANKYNFDGAKQVVKDLVFYIFPELKESEDERIRKEILQSIRDNMVVIHKDKCIAWLEKQGESYTKRDVDNAYLEGMVCAKNELEKQGQKPFDYENANIQQKDFAPKVEPFDKYEGLTDFERTLADICIGWIGQELGWKQYIKDSADVLLKIAIKMFNSVQDASFEQKPTDNDMIEALRTEYEKGRADAIAEMQKEWSEEDENILRTIISDGIRGAEFDMLQIDWLKSLKQRIGG